MNKSQIQGKWKQLKGAVREKWGELTEDDLEGIQGNRQRLIGRIQERYGKTKEAAEREVDDWFDRLEERVTKTR